MIVTFCGHSSFCGNIEYENKIISFLEESVGAEKVEMYLGGYGDFDDFAYKCCIKYKEKHPDASLVFVTPYMTESYQENHLKFIGQKYDFIIYPEIEEKPLRFAISYRNRWMIDRADLVICGIEHSWGGAYKTYAYAKSKKKAIVNIMQEKL